MLETVEQRVLIVLVPLRPTHPIHQSHMPRRHLHRRGHSAFERARPAHQIRLKSLGTGSGIYICILITCRRCELLIIIVNYKTSLTASNNLTLRFLEFKHALLGQQAEAYDASRPISIAHPVLFLE